ncbi:plasmid replication protein RepC [Pseudovibrio brasiliensis]|uniref:Replication protein C n=1 Tax=Pseudovibrio brasiliensis TaxID=1898042 RepID=A0ABX8AXA6_9HYPH|nr:plasmid replication protein RepC [Pseudovibrio brasiliensis]QUS59203.1 replication protein C [Pseudovibrio brasiliensis]
MQSSGSVASFRKLTPAMMRAQSLALANDVVTTTKAEVAMALKKAAPALGIDGTSYHILDILIGLTSSDDWQPDRRPLVAISNEKLAEYVCRSKRTVMRCLKRLVEAGIMAYRDSPTGRRYIHRGEFRNGKRGEIERGFGFDFSPARQRVHELKELGEAFAQRLKLEKDARRTVSRLLRAIEDMSSLAKKENIDFSEIDQSLEALSEKHLTVLQRAEILQDLYEMSVALFAEEDTQEGPETSLDSEVTCAGDIDDAPYNNTNPLTHEFSNKQRRSANADPITHNAPDYAGSEKAFEKTSRSRVGTSTQHQSNNVSLEHISLGLLKSALVNLQETLGFEVSSWADLIGSSEDISLLIGLSPAAWQQAEERVGRYTAAAVLATTAEKALRDPLLISSPGGYFRACVDRAMDGELALHKSLYGLAQAG